MERLHKAQKFKFKVKFVIQHLRTNHLRYRSNSAPEEAFMSTSDADTTNGDAANNATVDDDYDDDSVDCGSGEYLDDGGCGGGGGGQLAVVPPSVTSASPAAALSNGGGYNMVAARAVSQAEGGR